MNPRTPQRPSRGQTGNLSDLEQRYGDPLQDPPSGVAYCGSCGTLAHTDACPFIVCGHTRHPGAITPGERHEVALRIGSLLAHDKYTSGLCVECGRFLYSRRPSEQETS